MELLRDFCGSNGPKVFLYCGCTCLLTLVFAVALARQMDKQEECFGEKARKSLEEFNKTVEDPVEEEFVNYEEGDPEEPEEGPELLLVVRTNYKTALQLNEAGMINSIIGYSPVNYTIKMELKRRNSI